MSSHVVVLLTDKGYFDKAKRTIRDIRVITGYTGDLVLITIDFEPDKTYLLENNIINKRYDHINTDRLVEKIKKNPFNNSDGREYSKLVQWDKLRVFDVYFKKWNKVLYIDSGLRIFDSLDYFLNIDCKEKIIAPMDLHPDDLRRFDIQLETKSNSEVLQRLVDLYPDILQMRYFLNCIFMFDTNIIYKNTFNELIVFMEEFSICKTNEMGIMNIYFTAFKKIWQPLNKEMKDGRSLFEWSEVGDNTWKKYVSLKYPTTISFSQEALIKQIIPKSVILDPEPKFTIKENHDITYVTMFIDLAKLEGTDRKNSTTYLEAAKIFYDLRCNVIFYLEKDNIDYVYQKRKENGLEHLTKIVEITIEGLEYYKKVFKKTDYKNIGYLNGIKDTLNYKVLMMAKTELVCKAIKNGWIKTNCVAWCDFGIRTACPIIDEKFLYTSATKMRIAEINHAVLDDIKDMNSYYSSLKWFNAGGSLVSDIEHWLKFEKLLENEVDNALELGYCPTDEQLYTPIILKNPNLFEMYISDHPFLLCNYHDPIGGIDIYLRSIEKYRLYGQFREGFIHIEKLYNSFKRGKLQLSNDVILVVLDEYFIFSWRTDRKDICNRLGIEILLFCYENNIKMNDRIKQNIKLLL